VALTGGIATGKSTCLRRFATLGVPIIDADRLAREVIEPGTEGYARVVERFGAEIVGPEGGIDRVRLGQRVFADPAARHDLEAIVHPLVYQRILAWFDSSQATAARGFGVADIPLLYETGHAGDFDVVVVAVCSADEQLRRVMKRDNLTETEARQRIAAQWPIDQKRALADHVIDTSGARAETDARVTELVDRLERERRADVP